MSAGIIYCAHNIQTGKKYIGQTKRNLQERIDHHIWDSKRSPHRKFYRAFEKYGLDNFIWGIIEECDYEILDDREIFWIEYFSSYKSGYNSTLGGGGGLDPSRYISFTLKSPEGEIISSKNIAEFSRKYNLIPEAVGLVIKGKRKSHKGWTLPETEVIGNKCFAKEFTIMSPSGEIITGKNRAEFCRKNNLNPCVFVQVINGQLKSHKGWRLPQY